MMDTIEQRREMRSQLLHAIYEITGGSDYPRTDFYMIGEQLGWSRRMSFETARYLSSEGLIKFVGSPGLISMTHQGIVAVEQERERRQETIVTGGPVASQHVPAVINSIHCGNVVGSQILQGSAVTGSHATDSERTADVAIASGFQNRKSVEAQDEPVEQNVFQWDGEHWKISFDGKQLPPLNDLKGLRLIQYLIQHKGNEYPVLELCRRVLDTPDVASDEQARGVASRRISDDEEVSEDGLRLSGHLESRLERGEPEERERLKRELEKRQAQAEAVREMGGQPSIELEEEIEGLRERLAAYFDRKGRPRWESGQSRRAQVRVNDLLDRAEERLSKHCPALERHLRNTIRRENAVYSYRPDREIAWVV